MNTPFRVVIAIKKSSARGAYDILQHVCRTKCRNGITETGIGDRLVGLEAGGRFWASKTSPPREPAFLAKVIDGGYAGGRRSCVTHRHVVISMADHADYGGAETALRGVVAQWTNRFLGGCPAWCVAYHADKAHVHAHIVASNWNESEQRLLDWKRRDVVFMNSLRWYRGPVEAGAGLNRAPDRASRPKGYPLAETNLNTLLDLIQDGPGERIAALVQSGVLTPYFTKGGNRGFQFNGQKLTERHIAYELARRRGVGFGADGRPIPARLVQRSELQRQTLFDAQLGNMPLAEYERYEDSPPYRFTAEDWSALRKGIVPHNRNYRRVARTSVLKHLRYGFTPERDFALTPILSLLQAILLGDSGHLRSTEPASGGLFAFLCEMVDDLSSHAGLRKHMPALGRFNAFVKATPDARGLNPGGIGV